MVWTLAALVDPAECAHVVCLLLCLSLQELCALFRDMYKAEGMSRSKAKVEAEVNAAMVTYDTSGDGNLSLEEFINM